jgi:hypothetical protein
MRRKSDRTPNPVQQPVPPSVPSGAPSWVTLELIEDTIRVWQPRYGQPLTAEDALSILMNFAALADVLLEGEQR